MHVTIWHLILIGLVSLMATAQAYINSPRVKAIFFSLPVPLTFMALGAGHPLDASHVIGLAVVCLYLHAVRWLHAGRGLPILAAIAISVAGYVTIGTLLAQIVPKTAPAFWVSVAASMVLGFVLLVVQPPMPEPGHRSALPVWLKWPIMTAVILCLVMARDVLQGFGTVFPIMGTITTYEARHSLYTTARQGAVVMVVTPVMIAAAYLLQGSLGLGPALAFSWPVWLVTFLPVVWWAQGWRQALATRAVEG